MKLDKHDLALLRTLASEGPQFWKRPNQESRCFEMRRRGLVIGEMKVFSMTGGGRSSTYRTEYTITDAGRAELEKAKEPA